MTMTITLAVVFLLCVIAGQDLFTGKVFSNRWVAGALLLLLSNSVLYYGVLDAFFIAYGAGGLAKYILYGGFILFFLYFYVKINLFPVRKVERTSLFAKIMIGGRRLIYYGLWMGLWQVVFRLAFMGPLLARFNLALSGPLMAVEIVVSLTFAGIVLVNGFLRVFWGSKRLRVFRRIFILCTIWIPIFNIFLLLYLCHIAYLEYDHACYKAVNRELRAESTVCATQYPILMLHGVGFRDLKYINYWGRIPRELMRNGAMIYYGNQEAWGTVAGNAGDVRDKILSVLRETGAEKVNIIAHSKGGLDARYTLSALDMGRYVASLTTMNTPHRGCRFVDYACKTPEKIHRAIARPIDYYYKKIGDKNPDFYTATKQFTTAYLIDFNEEISDCPGVYYQSYTSVMKNVFSDFLLCVPYWIIRHLEGENDGLVSVDSAKWGEFRGVIRNRSRRGISHGDIIDLKREDYKGFDPAEKYVEILEDLKTKGY